ncbi:hypothetical protein Slala02_54510 [Streptomyces lavendulae subsp. lavendulae]|nr:hypothetical protein Slala01_07680 [Streptomyces lavendulae subsp. lavendulae]GLX29631.1 hypothetical protein Slala02_54510 [Streptomyces lavendulae subsp. lavendulae]
MNRVLPRSHDVNRPLPAGAPDSGRAGGGDRPDNGRERSLPARPHRATAGTRSWPA